MLKQINFFVLLFFGLNVFSQQQGANNFEHELISRVYFGSLPFDTMDIMNPPVGTTLFPCAKWSDFSLNNTSNVDANLIGLEYFTGVLRNETYNLESGRSH